MLVFKDVKIAKYFVVYSQVPTLKHKAKHGYVGIWGTVCSNNISKAFRLPLLDASGSAKYLQLPDACWVLWETEENELSSGSVSLDTTSSDVSFCFIIICFCLDHPRIIYLVLPSTEFWIIAEFWIMYLVTFLFSFLLFFGCLLRWRSKLLCSVRDGPCPLC